MISQRILIAGIGNIFLGDDAFGVEVAQRMVHRTLPEGVRVADFGIRGFDLAYALLDGYDTAIMVDATPRGGRPGTLYVIEPNLDVLNDPAPAVEPHNLDPISVLQLAKTLGGQPQNLLIVGCEPTPLGSKDGQLGLSLPVQAVVDEAIHMIEALVARIRSGEHLY